MNVGQELEKILKDNAAEFGNELRIDFTEIREYVAARTAYLATIVGQTGFEQALRAERDNVALKIGIGITKRADAADQRLLGVIGGVLSLGARALAGA